MPAKPPRTGAGPSRRKGALPSGARDLARRVRESAQLSGSQKRYWLRVLPFLQPADQARLDAILRGEVPPETVGDPDPAASPSDPAPSGPSGAPDLPKES